MAPNRPTRRAAVVTAMRRPVVGAGVLVACLCAAARCAAQPYEVPPDRSAAALIPDRPVAAEHYRIVDPVTSDGLMDHFHIDGAYGPFDAYGRIEARIRLHEMDALDTLARTSPVVIFAGGAASGVAAEVRTVGQVVRDPVHVVTGIPTGIAHLLGGYRARAEELGDSGRAALGNAGTGNAGAGKAGSDAGGGAAPAAVGAGADAAKRYAAKYLGMSAAERRWYEKLAVDPYTSNTVLKDAIRRASRVDAAGSFGMKFVSLAGIPGIDLVQRSMDAIYHEDPAAIRRRNRETLAGLGLTREEVARWQDTVTLSPTRQVLLLEAMKALDGVEGRADLLRHAMALDAETEAAVYAQSIALLVEAHRARPLAAVVGGVRLPAARRVDGSVVVCGAFDALYWTATVDEGEQRLSEALGAQGRTARELVIAGHASEQARAALSARGWTLTEGP